MLHVNVTFLPKSPNSGPWSPWIPWIPWIPWFTVHFDSEPEKLSPKSAPLRCANQCRTCHSCDSCDSCWMTAKHFDSTCLFPGQSTARESTSVAGRFKFGTSHDSHSGHSMAIVFPSSSQMAQKKAAIACHSIHSAAGCDVAVWDAAASEGRVLETPELHRAVRASTQGLGIDDNEHHHQSYL